MVRFYYGVLHTTSYEDFVRNGRGVPLDFGAIFSHTVAPAKHKHL